MTHSVHNRHLNDAAPHDSRHGCVITTRRRAGTMQAVHGGSSLLGQHIGEASQATRRSTGGSSELGLLVHRAELGGKVTRELGERRHVGGVEFVLMAATPREHGCQDAACQHTHTHTHSMPVLTLVARKSTARRASLVHPMDVSSVIVMDDEGCRVSTIR